MFRCGCCSSTLPAGSNGSLCEACALERVLAPERPTGEETFGAFTILCPIGEGGLGSVYLAEQTTPIQREVALKVLRAEQVSKESFARSLAEQNTLAQLNHPNIARLIDGGMSSAGRPWFAMEFIDGVPITEYCDRHAKSIYERIALFLEVCGAVDYAHSQGFLHRDLKPSNILTAEVGGNAVPKIIDFGIAKAMGGRRSEHTLRTEAGRVLGTPEYMSPEQADLAHGALSRATDVYCLGVILYELLCGSLPHDPKRLGSAGLAEILRIVRDEPPTPLRDHLSESKPDAGRIGQVRGTTASHLERQLRGELTSIVLRALEKDPRLRYSSAAEFAADLARYLRREPVLAHGGGFYHLHKQLVRHRRLIAYASLILLLAASAYVTSRSWRAAPPVPRVTPLTSFSGFEFDPELSPDERRLAFTWNNESKSYDVYVKPVESGDPIRITSDSGHHLHPSWSPDGKWLAYLRLTPSSKQIFVLPSNGGPERKLADLHARSAEWQPDASIVGHSPGPAWSPDGSTIAVGDRMDNQGPDCIYLIDAQTGTKRKLTNPAANSWADFLPAFSPDGREIAFVRAVNERGITDIFVADTATGKTRQVTFDGRTVSGLAWASRKQLVFTSNRTVGQMLWTIGSDGGNPELIADAGRNVARVSASRDGGRLVMVTSFRNTNIYRADLSKRGESVVKLISSSGRNDSPKYSPDGARVVFASDRSGWYELWIANADGTHARQLTHFDGRAIGTPRWSPDGTRIVFDGAKETRSAIYIIEASGGAPRVFAEDRRSCILPSWSQDGRFIYFVIRNDSGRSLLWKKPLNGGPAVQLTHQSYGDAIEAADGTVYFSDGQNGFWSVSNDGSNEAPVPGLERFRNTRYYALGARGIYSLRNVTAPWIIDLYDFKTHRTSPVASIERGILFGMPNLSVSPDDRWLLFTQLDGSGSDIQMVESYR